MRESVRGEQPRGFAVSDDALLDAWHSSCGHVCREGWRGLYFANNQKLYGVCGRRVYAISNAWVLTELGQIASTHGQVKMIDNGNTIILVDGSSAGYTIRLDDDLFGPITQDSFYGGIPSSTETDFSCYRDLARTSSISRWFSNRTLTRWISPGRRGSRTSWSRSR